MDKIYKTQDRIFAVDFARDQPTVTICEAEHKNGKVYIHDIIQFQKAE